MRDRGQAMNQIFAALLVTMTMLAPGLLGAGEAGAERAVLVTGASSGIGLTTAKLLADRGFYVYAGARSDADLARLDAMENVTSVRLDVTVQEDVDGAAKFILAQGRGLYGVVNNAGIGRISPLSSVADEDVLRMHDVNVMGPLRVNRAFLPMLKKSGGRTVIIGSLSGFVTGPSGGAYSMSKFAVEAYTDTLAAELAESGVTVGIIDPGAYRSRGREKAVMHMLTGSPELEQPLNEEQQATLSSIKEVNSKLKEPNEVAEAVAHFLSSDSPRLRYMVAPDKETAELVIRTALERVVQLNADQEYEFGRDALIALLDELLGEMLHTP